jgi:Mn2+/Fe2+ NRAMP family transporter
MVLSSVLNGILLPFVLIYALSLVNNKKIMGEYVNPRMHNIISWGTVGVLTVLTLFFIISFLIPEGGFYG